MKDMFCDIVVEEDNRTYHLLDLPRMAQALDIGLITTVDSGAILRRVDWVVRRVTQGAFPLEEIQRGRAAAARLGW
jgi:predicted RNA-binding protein associated with RNAse of E/G family